MMLIDFVRLDSYKMDLLSCRKQKELPPEKVPFQEENDEKEEGRSTTTSETEVEEKKLNMGH